MNKVIYLREYMNLGKKNKDCKICRGSGFISCKGRKDLGCENVTVRHSHLCGGCLGKETPKRMVK